MTSPWDVALAALNVGQTGLLAWIASRSRRRRREDGRRSSHGRRAR